MEQKYKLLQVGERYREGDEIRTGTLSWEKVVRPGVCRQDDQDYGLIYRRRVRRSKIEVFGSVVEKHNRLLMIHGTTFPDPDALIEAIREVMDSEVER